MSTKSRFWADLTTRDFARLKSGGAAANTVAVLPVAAVEQHGPHLPVSVDATLVEGVVIAAFPHLAADVDVLFMPTQQIGKSNEHERFAGTLSFSAETLIRTWTELGESVARAGIRKLVLLNSHGGQVSVMDIVARDLRARLDIITYSVSWFNLPLGAEVDGLFSAEEHRFGIHGGDVETSMMLALRPQFVDMSQARDFKSTSQVRAAAYPILGNGKSARMGWQMQDYNPAGAAGNAAAATVEKGRAVLDAAGRALAQLLGEIAELPLSTLVDAPDLPD
ncbi:MAG: creatininase family protein [Comamonadaceae bacterium]|nr:MAG: creatininase family protein [Comamonadaceae bacterium]